MEILNYYVTLKRKCYVIMKSKLTLNIDKELSDKAKTYARSQGRSLSDLVESYFSLLTRDKLGDKSELTPKVKFLAGSLKGIYPEDFDYKKELEKLISEKYLSNEENIS